MRFLLSLFAAALAASTLTATGALAAEPAATPTPDPAVIALPGKMVTALIADDAAALRTLCAANATVVDEFAPYVWSGADACVRWAAGFKAFAKQIKLTNFKATVAPKPFTDVSGARTYLVARVTFAGLMDGKPIAEQGTWTFAVVKTGAAQKITALAWGTLHR
jgi:hypothetical protein